MHKLKTQLMEFGLFEKEAEAYLKLLSAGEAKISELAASPDVLGSFLVALDSLADRELILKNKVGDVFYYQAKDPEHVLASLQEKKARAELSRDKIDKVMLNLNWLYTQSGGKKEKAAGVYQGYEGVLEIRKKIFEKKHQNIYNITSLHQYLPRAHVESMLENVNESYLAIVPQRDEKYLKELDGLTGKNSKLKIKLAPDAMWPDKSEVLIFGDYVAFGDIEDEQRFVLIQNELVAQNMKTMFENMWSDLK
ncbi:MAG TPA: hypothetical protein VMX18_04465 [Candidatus Bipolaricaulota bacterium]|nr:hypothetical protein [Candidatus Bipolaricaulota bacterium]